MENHVANLEWNKKICLDESLWHQAAFKDYPSVIAHEYYRLYQLLEEGQTYGALWQCKDLFEVLLKFPSLISLAQILGKSGRDGAENKVLIKLLEKPLSMGDWLALASSMLSVKDLEPEIRLIIKDLVDIYNKNSIVHWRNMTIGHGALAFDNNQEFQEDLKSKIEIIKSHLVKHHQVYSEIQVIHDNMAGAKGCTSGEFILKGKSRARNIVLEEGKLFFAFKGIKVGLDPFMLFYKGGVYFFDSYYPRKKKTAVLNYPTAERQNIAAHQLEMIYRSLVHEERTDQMNSSLEDQEYLEEEEEVLGEIASVTDFQLPNHLHNWLTQSLSQFSKGIFLLKMERGTGKSTFCRALDPLSLAKIQLPEFTVRAYYCNDTYHSTADDFVARLSDQLRKDQRGKLAISGSNLPTISLNSPRRTQELADVLLYYKERHRKFYGRHRLLLIVDGLDEIPAGQEVSLFDLIPHPDQMEEGVFILLTCRSGEDLPLHIQSNLNKVQVTDSKTILKSSSSNSEVLKEYLSSHLNLKDEGQLDLLLQKGDHRFLYLKLLKDILNNSSLGVESLPTGAGLFKLYLECLKISYGEKYFSGLLRMICILATAFEPLTIQEISKLMGEDKPTFKVLSYLSDSRTLFKIERSYRGNLISIAHSELQELLRERYALMIKEMIKGWLAEKEGDQFQVENDGDSYLLAHFFDYTGAYLEPEYTWNLSEEAIQHYIRGAIQLRDSLKYTYQRRRLVAIYSQILQLKNTGLDVEWATVYNNRGNALLHIGGTAKALEDFNQALEICLKQKEEGRLSLQDLSGIYRNRGRTYIALGKIVVAINDFNQGIAVLKELREKVPEYRDYLADLYVSRGNAYIKRGNSRFNFWYKFKAIEDYNRGLKIKNTLLSEGKVMDEVSLAGVYFNRGLANFALRNTKKAIRDFNQAIAIGKKLQSKGQDTENLVGTCYKYRGTALKKGQQALENLNHALDIKQKLWESGKLLNEDELAEIYLNRGITYRVNGDTSKALGDLERAFIIRAKPQDGGRPDNISGLQGIFLQLALVYFKEKNYLKALESFLESMLAAQKIYKNLEINDNPSLINGTMKKYFADRDILGDLGFVEEEVDEVEAESCGHL